MERKVVIMKQVSVYLPKRIYRLLKEMREENIIPSISEFIRNVVILAIFFKIRKIKGETKCKTKGRLSTTDTTSIGRENREKPAP